MILADTSGLLALLDEGEPDHAAVTKLVKREPGPLLVTDFVLAETDFLVLDRLGARAERDFLAQLSVGALLREPITANDLTRAIEISTDYLDQEFGLTDATLMALAERLGRPVLTLDRRHFTTFRTKKGKPLRLLP